MAEQRSQFQLGLVAAIAGLLAASLVKPRYPDEQWLQHTPTVLALAALLVAARRDWLSNAAMVCLAAFVALHIVGARWIYSYVPYERLCDATFGAGPREWFGWTRNHYDRFVHVAFGALLVWPLVDVATRFAGVRRTTAALLSVGAVASASAVYEILEWLIAIVAAPDYAEAYNGQQGDPWDAQKDMALAIAAAAVTGFAVAIGGAANVKR